MPRPSTRTRRKRGKWARYNSRRAANREADRLKRQATRAARLAAREAALLDLAAHPPPVPVPPTRPPLRLRFTVEISGYPPHAFEATWLELFGRWSVPQRQILRGIRELMQHAPRIAKGR